MILSNVSATSLEALCQYEHMHVLREVSMMCTLCNETVCRREVCFSREQLLCLGRMRIDFPSRPPLRA